MRNVLPLFISSLITRWLKSKQIYFEFQSLSQKTMTLITIKSSQIDPENTDREIISFHSCRGDYAMLPDGCVNSRRLFLHAMMSLSEQWERERCKLKGRNLLFNVRISYFSGDIYWIIFFACAKGWEVFIK